MPRRRSRVHCALRAPSEAPQGEEKRDTSRLRIITGFARSTLSGLRRRLRRGAEAASPLAAHLSQRGERVAKRGAVQATHGRRGRRRQRRCCCCGGGRDGLGLLRRRHRPGGARTLLDSGTHLGLGLGLWMRVRVEVSCFGLWATYYGYTYCAAYYSYSLLTALALARLAAASCASRACRAGCVCASEVGSERIIAHLVRNQVSKQASKQLRES